MGGVVVCYQNLTKLCLPSKITCFEKKYIKMGKNSMMPEYTKTVLKGDMFEELFPLSKLKICTKKMQ